MLRPHHVRALLLPADSPTSAARIEAGADGRFTFQSPVQSGSPRNDVVHGRLFAAGKSLAGKPLVVIVHGWNAELHYIRICPLLARALNRRGLHAALIELPYHLHRRPANQERREGMPDFICNNIPGMLSATRQAIADMNALLRWAKAEGCSATALWGFSLGGWLAGLHLCFSDAQDAAVLTTPVSDLKQAVRELDFCHPIRSALEVSPVELNTLNLRAHKPRIAPEKILLVQGEYDQFVPAATCEELARAWGIARWEKVKQGHISILVSMRAMRRCMDWLEWTFSTP